MEVYLPIADMTISLYILLCFGFAAGILSGLYGIGGGVLMTPVMIFYGIPTYIAIGTASCIICGTAFSGSLYNLRNGSINFRIGIVLLIGSCLGSVIGLYILSHLRLIGNLDIAVSITYICVLSIATIVILVDVFLEMMKKDINLQTDKGVIVKSKEYKSLSPALKEDVMFICFLGLIVGLLSSVMGIGGAIILVPLLAYFFRVPFKIASATALFQSCGMSIIMTIMQSVNNQAVDIVLCATIICSSVIGVQFGTRFAACLNQVLLKLSMSVMTSIICIKFLIKIFAVPKSFFIMN